MKPERCSQRNSTAFFLIHQLVWRWLWKKLTHLQTKWTTAQWWVFLFGFILLKWRVIKQIQNHISRRQHVGLIDSSCNSSSRFYLRNHCCCSLSDILAFISDNGVTKEIKTWWHYGQLTIRELLATSPAQRVAQLAFDSDQQGFCVCLQIHTHPDLWFMQRGELTWVKEWKGQIVSFHISPHVRVALMGRWWWRYSVYTCLFKSPFQKQKHKTKCVRHRLNINIIKHKMPT